MKMKLYYGALALLWLLSSCTPSSNVTDNYDKIGTCRSGDINMFSEPRFRVGTKADDGNYYIDVRERFNEGVEDESDLITLEDCPQVNYVGGYESDTERDTAMTHASDQDIAFIRGKSKSKSGTAENILRRRDMKFINPYKYVQD